MKLFVFGSDGMLGRRVVEDATQKVSVVPLNRAKADISDPARVAQSLVSNGVERGDQIINCAGLLEGPYPDLLIANALGPAVLADVAAEFGCRLVHVSTDCVLEYRTVKPEMRAATAHVRPVSPYARAKAAGEVQAFHVVNVRTSFIGPEHGLLAWLLSCPDSESIPGWVNAWWSGSHVDAVASALVFHTLRQGWEWPISHLATAQPISKFDLLTHLANRYRPDLKVVPIEALDNIDRSLWPTHFLPAIYSG